MKQKRMVPNVLYIRKKPAIRRDGVLDFSFMSTPLVFDGVNDKGNFLFHYPLGTHDAVILGTTSRALPKEFSDDNWIPIDATRSGVKTSLHEWKGRRIRTKNPIKVGKLYDRFYIWQPCVLVCATRYHLTIEDPLTGKLRILDSRYANPSDWTLA